MPRENERIISGCGLSGMMNRKGVKISGEAIINSIACLHERGNGLGGGFAAYGIYPAFKDQYAFHLMYDHPSCKEKTERYLNEDFEIDEAEKIPTEPHPNIVNPPILWRYFVQPKKDKLRSPENMGEINPDDFVVKTVMHVNENIDGAYIFSSGKNMGAFKAVGYPEDVGRFYRLSEYKAYIWTSHGRFPTNTPGWWGGAHPFTILDWSVVHNGEISSYGINKRYLEMFGYKCTLMTDTEVMAYLFDLLHRRHGLPLDITCLALAPPFWKQIDRMSEEKKEMIRTLRTIYASAMVNGPFAVIVAHSKGMIGFNDRIKLRPMVAGRKGDWLYISSEESGIRQISPDLDEVWAPQAGHPVIGEVEVEV